MHGTRVVVVFRPDEYARGAGLQKGSGVVVGLGIHELSTSLTLTLTLSLTLKRKLKIACEANGWKAHARCAEVGFQGQVSQWFEWMCKVLGLAPAGAEGAEL